MESIIYVGMDVHSTNYTLCCFSFGAADTFAHVDVQPAPETS